MSKASAIATAPAAAPVEFADISISNLTSASRAISSPKLSEILESSVLEEPIIVSATSNLVVIKCCAIVSTSCARSASTPSACELKDKISIPAGRPNALESALAENDTSSWFA